MAYRWLTTGEASARELADAGLAHTFESQADAEEWLGAFYEELSEAGVEAVSLFEEDRLVYGPMSLEG